jgi:CBS-domain-containing membrane protein
MVYIVPSVGASAVLLFAVPNSALGQLWYVIGDHLISATIGVTCYQ